jgi:hypothetical protein
VAAVNRAVTALIDGLMSPLHRLPPIFGLLALSLLTALAALLVFKWASDQRSLFATKRAIQAAVFEMRLFSDDLRMLFGAQAEVLRHTMRYIRLSLVPTAWLLVPVLVLMLHTHFYFGYTGLVTGEAALVKVVYEPAAMLGKPGQGPVLLLAPAAIRVETPAVVFPSQREVVWRIRPRASGSYELRVRVGERVLNKMLVVSDDVVRRSPTRPKTGVAEVLNPSEPPLPQDSGLTAITVTYPERRFDLAGWSIDWMFVYLALTVIFAVALRGVLGVTI